MKSVCLPLFVLLAIGSVARGQGSLTSPGAPAPTMKTLDQIEARTPVAASTSTVTLTADGAYYLTGNITVASGDGLDVSANNVTLDLNGFTVATASTATASGNSAISYTGSGYFVVRNGHLAGTAYNAAAKTFAVTGFTYGVQAGNNARGVRIEELDLFGIATDGIYSYTANTVVSHCQANGIGNFGVHLYFDRSVVDRCTVQASGGGILAAIVTGCTVEAVSGNIGISALTVSDTYVLAANNTAISADSVTNCTARSEGGNAPAIQALNATNSSGVGTTGPGLTAANGSAIGCTGTCSNGNSAGLSAAVTSGCTGSSLGGSGLVSASATNCTGSTSNTGTTVAYGIDCNGGIATGCSATATFGNVSLRARIANSCVVTGGTTSITNKYNMP